MLSRADIVGLLSPTDYITAVTEAFRAEGHGATEAPPPLHVSAAEGGFHTKGALLRLPDGRAFVGVKINANFPGNPARHDLPTIQGVIVLSDATSGTPLAIMDSIEVTVRRTAAATALAARHLARSRARTVTLVGCGAQAAAQIEALIAVRPVEQVFLVDIDHAKAMSLAETIRERLPLRVAAMSDRSRATRASDIIVTCTTSTTPFLGPSDVAAGAFIAAVGADAPHKSEIAPALMARAKIVADSVAQCREMGDLHHASDNGTCVYGSLAEIVCGIKPGRETEDEITLFDSTGVAIEDVASSVCVWERANSARRGHIVKLIA